MLGPTRLLGLVLAGGRSSRMGTDKALVDFGGQPMALRIAMTMYEAGVLEVLLGGASTRVGQELDLTIAPEPKPGFGPLSGIAAGLAAASRADPAFDAVVVCPCDTPEVTSQDLQLLIECIQHRTVDVACFRTPHGLEPLVSVWRPDGCLTSVLEALELGQGAVRRVIGKLNHTVCEAPVPTRLANLNSPDELTAALNPSRSDSECSVAQLAVEEPN